MSETGPKFGIQPVTSRSSFLQFKTCYDKKLNMYLLWRHYLIHPCTKSEKSTPRLLDVTGWIPNSGPVSDVLNREWTATKKGMRSVPPVFAFDENDFSKKEIRIFLKEYMNRRLKNGIKREATTSHSPKKKRRIDDTVPYEVNISSDVSPVLQDQSSSLTEISKLSTESVQSSYIYWDKARALNSEVVLNMPKKLSKRLERILRNKPNMSKNCKMGVDMVNGVNQGKGTNSTMKNHSVSSVVYSRHGVRRRAINQFCQQTLQHVSDQLHSNRQNKSNIPQNSYLCCHGDGILGEERPGSLKDKNEDNRNSSGSKLDSTPESSDDDSGESDHSLNESGHILPDGNKDTIPDGDRYDNSFPDITQYVALDCEFVGVGDRKTCALGRCSIVDYKGDVLYDGYAIPNTPITDYRTQWSGIRPRDMKFALPQEIVQESVRKIIQGKIVIGHSLYNDFKNLNLRHPRRQIRDTHSYKPLKQMAATSPSLKNLTKNLLGLDIQRGEHSSLEDARAALNLYLLVRDEWELKLKQKEVQNGVSSDNSPAEEKETSVVSCQKSFLDDEFWPDDL